MINLDDYKLKTIEEGTTKIEFPEYEKVSSDAPVFYNPHMELNRDISMEQLISNVATKGGCTAVGVDCMNENNSCSYRNTTIPNNLEDCKNRKKDKNNFLIFEHKHQKQLYKIIIN